MVQGCFDEDIYTKCPYYKWQTKCVICCEGVRENSSIHMAFAGKKDRLGHQKVFCRDHWCRCVVAQALNRKWGYEEDTR